MVGAARMSDEPPKNEDALQLATQKLIDSPQQENANMQVTRQPSPGTLNGQRALTTYPRNDSPTGGMDADMLVTVLRPQGLVYFVGVAPEKEFANFSAAFDAILDSLRFK